MPIKGLTNQLRMPRAGKIHLGVKSTSNSGAEYPTPTDYFVCPQEVIDALGDPRPKELNIMFPTEEAEQFAPTYLKFFSRTRGLICKGDGETADRTVNMKKVLGPEGVIDNIPDTPEAWPLVDRDAKPEDIGRHKIECRAEQCPDYGKRGCGRMMMLQFLLPDVPGLGIYQIDTGSRNGILNIYGGLELVRAIAGRVSMIPLKLRIGPVQTTSPETGKAQTNYIMSLDCDRTMEALSKYRQMGQLPDLSTRQLPDPDDEFPDYLVAADLPEEEAPAPALPEPAAVMAPPRPAPPEPKPQPAPPEPAPGNVGYGNDVWSLTFKEMGAKLTSRREALGVTQEALKAQATAIGLDNPRKMKADQFMTLMDWMQEKFGKKEDGYVDPPTPTINERASEGQKQALGNLIRANHITNELLDSAMLTMDIPRDQPWISKTDLAKLMEWAEGFTDDEHTGKEPETDPETAKIEDTTKTQPNAQKLENEAALPDVVGQTPKNGPTIPDVVVDDEKDESLEDLLNSVSDVYSWEQTLMLASQLGIMTRKKLETDVLHMPSAEWDKVGGSPATAAKRLMRYMIQQRDAAETSPAVVETE